MVKREVIQKRLEKSQEYIEFLNNIKDSYNLNEFKNNKMVYGSSERFLHLTIEALLDMGNHLVSDQDLGNIDTYRDIPIILFQNEFISSEQKEIFIKIIGFRNILVHDYLDIDKETVYKIITENLSDLTDLLKMYAEQL
ncbi:MAG: DUF86 domain-containing protein [Halarsenatibacteraceae bacterium]